MVAVGIVTVESLVMYNLGSEAEFLITDLISTEGGFRSWEVGCWLLLLQFRVLSLSLGRPMALIKYFPALLRSKELNSCTLELRTL
jgi:hypothetical protein